MKLLVTSLFGPNILLSTLFSNTLSLCSSLNVKRPGFAPIQNHRQNYSHLYSNVYIFLTKDEKTERTEKKITSLNPNFGGRKGETVGEKN
jgi:hypothetical protein